MNYHVITRANTGMHCFFINPKLLKGLENEKRVICTIGQVSFHCALMKNKGGAFCVYIGKDKLKILGVVGGLVVKPKFQKDTSRHQFELPEEFKEVLRSDPEAKEVFDKLTDGGKRGLLYLVNKMKSTDKRIEKSLLIAEKLRSGITSPRYMTRR